MGEGRHRGGDLSVDGYGKMKCEGWSNDNMVGIRIRGDGEEGEEREISCEGMRQRFENVPKNVDSGQTV